MKTTLSKSGKMTDRLQAMSILAAVVDAGSLSAGARALQMPVATVITAPAAIPHNTATAINTGQRCWSKVDCCDGVILRTVRFTGSFLFSGSFSINFNVVRHEKLLAFAFLIIQSSFFFWVFVNGHLL